MISREPPELDAETRAVIDAGRGGHEPNELSRARVRRGVDVKLAAGLALAVGPASSALAGAFKLTAAVVAVGSVVATGMYVLPRQAPEPAASPTKIGATTRVATTTPASPAVEPPAPALSAPRASKRRAAAPPPAAALSASSLKEEIALLGAANAALARGDVTRARSVLDDYDRRPGAPMLAEERAVTGILASCATRQVEEARAAARLFRARWPRSPLAARVDASCAAAAARPLRAP
jgi:hypothetical protein